MRLTTGYDAGFTRKGHYQRNSSAKEQVTAGSVGDEAQACAFANRVATLQTAEAAHDSSARFR